MFLFPLFRLYVRFGLIMWGRACPLCPVISLLKGGSDLKNHCTFMTFLHEDMYLFKDQILSQFVFCSSNQCKNISVLVFQFVCTRALLEVLYKIPLDFNDCLTILWTETDTAVRAVCSLLSFFIFCSGYRSPSSAHMTLFFLLCCEFK